MLKDWLEKGLCTHKLVLVFDIDNEPWQPIRAVETTRMIHFHRYSNQWVAMIVIDQRAMIPNQRYRRH
jgi:hypothetical protein